ESAALALLRALDEAAAKNRNRLIEARAPTEVALYLLNEKREALAALEANRHVRLRVAASAQLTPPDFELNVAASFEDEAVEADAETRASVPRRQVEAVEEDLIEADEAEEEDEESEIPAAADAEGEEEGARRRRRRGRRGGRRRREENG